LDPHTKALLKEAAHGLEDALRLAGHGQTFHVTLEYMTPQARLRQQADEMDYREAKIAELVALFNRLREATK
jgi:hypothetical protein